MKNILCFFIVLFIFSNISAQEQEGVEYPVKGDSQIGFSVGTYGGISTKDGFSPVEGTATINNLGFAFSYETFMSKNWSFKTGLTYDPKGSQSILGINKLKLQYITVPVLLNWHFGKKRRWYLHFGPYIGRLMSANQKAPSGPDIDFKGLFNTYDAGLDIGIGIKIPIASKMFFIETDGQTGFSNPGRNTDSNIVLSRNTLSIGMIF